MRKLKSSVCQVLFCAMILSSAHADTLFKGVRVFDGEQLISKTSVLVSDGTIVEIGEQIVSDTAEVIDGEGKTLLPGFIDCHVHVFFPAQLELATVFGTTTVLDMMSVPRLMAMYKQQQADGKADRQADLFSAGAAVTVDGGHGTQFGFKVPTLATAEEADQFVADRIEEGSDYIKIIYETGTAYGFEKPTLSKEMVEAAIKATHKRGKLAVAHIGSREGARLLISLGIDGLVHGFADEAIDDELIALAKEKGVFIVPTAVVTKLMKEPVSSSQPLIEDPRLNPFVNQLTAASLRTRFPGSDGFKLEYRHMQDAIGKLHDAGVVILAGTDAPNPGTSHGVSLLHELELLVEAGLTPQDALMSVTSLPAKSFQLTDRGRIATGFKADLVLVNGDPMSDILIARDIVDVWKNGKRIDREKVRQQVAKFRAEQEAKEKAEAVPAG